jgi:superoxide reductase
MKMKFLMCKRCGTVVEMIRQGDRELCCCGERMECFSKGEEQKHMPVISALSGEATVSLAEGTHPMDEEHYIGWIALSTNRGVQRRALMPNEKPEVSFPLSEGEKPREAVVFCNLHGVWHRHLDFNC